MMTKCLYVINVGVGITLMSLLVAGYSFAQQSGQVWSLGISSPIMQPRQ